MYRLVVGYYFAVRPLFGRPHCTARANHTRVFVLHVAGMDSAINTFRANNLYLHLVHYLSFVYNACYVIYLITLSHIVHFSFYVARQVQYALPVPVSPIPSGFLAWIVQYALPVPPRRTYISADTGRLA